MPLNMSQLEEQIDAMVTDMQGVAGPGDDPDELAAALQACVDAGDQQGAVTIQARLDELEARRADELGGKGNA